MTLLNFFFRSKYFDNLNPFLSKKIFKFLKIFFVETELNNLPETNYPLPNTKAELEKSKMAQKNNLRPYITYAHLPDLLEMLTRKNEKINFVDIGAGNLIYITISERNLKI